MEFRVIHNRTFIGGEKKHAQDLRARRKILDRLAG